MSSSEISEFTTFLTHCKSSLLDIDSTENIYVVIGTEAGDLDTVVSTLVYAFFLHKKNNSETSIYIPFLDINRAEYRLKTEVTFALKQHKITADLLIFRDQISLEELFTKRKLKLILLDHNVLPAKDEKYDSAICQIIDHHEKAREPSPSVFCKIELVGSCCTLIAEMVLNDPEVTIPKELCSLLYGTILLDTVCFSEAAAKTTPKDIKYVEALEKRLGKVSRKEVFEELQTAKMDLSGLTAVEVLQKDLKIVSSGIISVSMSSMPRSLKDVFSGLDIDVILKEFSVQQGSALVVIMSLYLDHQGEPHRELALYSEDIWLRDQISSHLKQAQPDLRLVPLLTSLSASSHFVPFAQLNVKASRKVVLPLVRNLLETL